MEAPVTSFTLLSTATEQQGRSSSSGVSKPRSSDPELKILPTLVETAKKQKQKHFYYQETILIWNPSGKITLYERKKNKNRPNASLSDLEVQSADCDGMVWKTVKNSRLDRTFTVKKVKSAFAHMGSYKSAGPNGFKTIVMKHFGPKALGCINNLFKQFIQLDTFQLNFVNLKWSSFRSH